MDIYLIRHGQSTGNTEGTFLGWSDHPLTDLGKAQAAAVAERLALLGPVPVHCSDLQRTRETAEIITRRLGGSLIADPRWRETNCGDFSGKSWNDFMLDKELSRRFEEDQFGTAMPGGESAADMAERVQAAFQEICGCNDPCVVIVTHAGPIHAVLAHCLLIPPERYWALKTERCGITHINVTDGWISVRTVNETAHLAEGLHG